MHTHENTLGVLQLLLFFSDSVNLVRMCTESNFTNLVDLCLLPWQIHMHSCAQHVQVWLQHFLLIWSVCQASKQAIYLASTLMLFGMWQFKRHHSVLQGAAMLPPW